MDLTDSIFLFIQMVYRYHNGVFILISFGHNNHVVKI